MKRDSVGVDSEPLFSSAAAAVAFALNFSGHSYQSTVVNRMAGPPSPAGRGLGGLDGAAQAGMIRAELASIGMLGEAIITAEMAHKTKPCFCKAPCCAGEVTNAEWSAAIGVLSNLMKDLKICPSHFVVRTNLLRRFFGVDISISEISRQSGLSRDTITAYNSKLVSVLKTERKRAWAEFDRSLIERGMIDPKENP